jgi:hypothetical protein
MNIAILFYGRINHFDKKYLINILNSDYLVDIFYSGDQEPPELIEQFIKIYNPISINNEKISHLFNFEKYYNINQIACKANMDNMTRHFINLKRVFNLLETHVINNNIIYDLVISTRLDLCIDKLNIYTPIHNTIYIPIGEDHTGINDRFAMGDIETMKKYMNIIDNCLYLLDNNLSNPHPETLTLSNIKYSNLKIIRFNMSTVIIR